MVRSQARQQSLQFTIGGLATQAGVNVETIRYYQRRGLMDEPARPSVGQRRYDDAALTRLRFIKRAQALGFTLDEIQDLLGLDEAHACGETRELAARKLAMIDGKLADLRAIRGALTTLLKQCEAGAADGSCPIIHSLRE